MGRKGLPGGNGVIIVIRTQDKERRILSKGYGKDFTSYDSGSAHDFTLSRNFSKIIFCPFFTHLCPDVS